MKGFIMSLITKMKKTNFVLLSLSLILFIIGFVVPWCSRVSALLAIITAIIQMYKGWKMEDKLNAYDEALQTKYNAQGEIEEMAYDCGTF